MNSTYAGFPKAIVFTTEPRFDVKRTYCVNARPGGNRNSLIGKMQISAIKMTFNHV